MAYLPPSQKKNEQDAQAQGVDMPASGLGPTSPVGGATPAAPTPPAQQSGTGFPGVQAFLAANRGGALQQGISARQADAERAAGRVAYADSSARGEAGGSIMFNPTSQDDVNGYWGQHLNATQGARDAALRKFDQTTNLPSRWDRAIANPSNPTGWTQLRAALANPTAPTYQGTGIAPVITSGNVGTGQAPEPPAYPALPNAPIDWGFNGSPKPPTWQPSTPPMADDKARRRKPSGTGSTVV